MTDSVVVSKKPWESKTIWINFIVGIAGALAYFWPAASGIEHWIQANDALIGSLWAVLNVILRLVSKDSITLKD